MIRNRSVDIAKGIGILLVVAGHNWLLNHHPGLLFQMIYSFHMPLFFLLGGVFLHTRQRFVEFVRVKADTLLKPYLVVLTLLGIFRIYVGAATPASYFPGVLYATGATIDWVQLWFLPSLFLTLVSVWLALRLLERTPFVIAGGVLLVLVLFLLGAITAENYRAIPAASSPLLTRMFGADAHLRGLPFSLDLLPLTAAFLLLGYLLRERIQQPVFRPGALFAAVLVFATAHLLFRYTTDLNLREYGNWFITPLRALAGIYIVLSLSTLLAQYPLAARPLAYLGEASLIILLFHAYVEWAIFGKFVKRYADDTTFAGIVAFAGSLAVSIALYELSKRITPMSWLLLHRRRVSIKPPPYEQAA